METPGEVIGYDKLFTALAKAQGEMTGAVKDGTNPHFHSTYATLASVWDACRGPLSKNGLAVIQTPIEKDGKHALLTILGHTSGQSVESIMPIMMAKNDAQGYGSGLSYARRYSLMSIAGIASEDDDGNSAAGKPPTPVEFRGPEKAARATPIAAPVPLLKDKRLDKPADYIVEFGVFSGKKLSEIPREKLELALTRVAKAPSPHQPIVHRFVLAARQYLS